MTDFAEILRRMRNRIESKELRCKAIGCPAIVKSRIWFCSTHLTILPKSMKDKLYAVSEAELPAQVDRAVDFIAEQENRGRDS